MTPEESKKWFERYGSMTVLYKGRIQLTVNDVFEAFKARMESEK